MLAQFSAIGLAVTALILLTAVHLLRPRNSQKGHTHGIQPPTNRRATHDRN